MGLNGVISEQPRRREGHSALQRAEPVPDASSGAQTRSGLQPLLVLGMHRSGTSALARVVNLLGAALPRDLWPANDFNVAGYWESKELTDIQEQVLSAAGCSWDLVGRLPREAFRSDVATHCRKRAIDLLKRDLSADGPFVLKDPRMSVLVPFWREVLGEFCDVTPVYLIIVRHPTEVSDSLKRRNGFLPEQSMLLWLRYTLEAEHCTRGSRRCFVSYDDLMADPCAVAERIARVVGINWPRPVEAAERDIRQWIRSDLRHHRSSADALDSDSAVAPWVRDVYQAVLRACRRAGDDDFGVYDRVRSALDEADRLYGALMQQHRQLRHQTHKQEYLLSGIKAHSAQLAEECSGARAEVVEVRQQNRALKENNRHLLEQREQVLRTRLREQEAAATQLEQLRQRSDQLNEENRRLRGGVAPGAAAWLRRCSRSVFRHLPTNRSIKARLSTSGLVDAEFYRRQLDGSCGADPLTHYLSGRSAQLADPHPLFCQRWYLAKYPDVAESRFRPLVHYLLHGQAEHRSPHPLFDVQYYLTQAQSAGEGDEAARRPLEHFLSRGWQLGLTPNYLFHPKYYLDVNTVVDARHTSPFLHFLTVGWREGRNPHPLFDVRFYLWRYPAVAESGENPLMHFMQQGKLQLCDPNRLFDSRYYYAQGPDIAQAGLSPLEHYLTHGQHEGRRTSALFDSAAYARLNPEHKEMNIDPLSHYLWRGCGGGG